MKKRIRGLLALSVAGIALLSLGCSSSGTGYTSVGVGYGYPYYGPGWGYYPYGTMATITVPTDRTARASPTAPSRSLRFSR